MDIAIASEENLVKANCVHQKRFITTSCKFSTRMFSFNTTRLSSCRPLSLEEKSCSWPKNWQKVFLMSSPRSESYNTRRISSARSACGLRSVGFGGGLEYDYSFWWDSFTIKIRALTPFPPTWSCPTNRSSRVQTGAARPILCLLSVRPRAPHASGQRDQKQK